jgi:HSP20 family protein
MTTGKRSKSPENLPVGLDRIVNRCLEADPHERWQCARDLKWELESFRVLGKGAIRAPERVPHCGRNRSRFGEDSEGSQQRQTRAEATEGIFLPTDIYEEERELVVQVEVPGLSEEDVDVRIEHKDLVVSGELPALLRRRGATPYMIERQHGRFVRAYPLPETVEAIRNVNVRNGVLEVVLEKAASSIGKVGEVVAEQRPARARAQSVANAAFHHHEETAGS